MSKQVTKRPDHDKIAPLLPWFVNQTLDAHQRGAVERHIEHCVDCQREILLLTSLQDTVQNDAQSNYRLHADIDKDLASVMNRIDTKSCSTNTMASGASLLKQKLADIFTFDTTLPLFKLSATALACLLVAVLAAQLFYEQADDNYSVLSSSDSSDSRMRLSVEIATEVDQDQVRSKIQYELEKIGQPVDIETDSDGHYIIVFRDPVGVNELSKLISDLENEAQINGVEILP